MMPSNLPTNALVLGYSTANSRKASSRKPLQASLPHYTNASTVNTAGRPHLHVPGTTAELDLHCHCLCFYYWLFHLVYLVMVYLDAQAGTPAPLDCD
jgi:hypothetical protein